MVKLAGGHNFAFLNVSIDKKPIFLPGVVTYETPQPMAKDYPIHRLDDTFRLFCPLVIGFGS
jgi:hypothetical protein